MAGADVMSEAPNKLKIVAPMNMRESTIELNGKRLDGVTEVSFYLTLEELTIATIRLVADVEANAEWSQEDMKVERKPWPE